MLVATSLIANVRGPIQSGTGKTLKKVVYIFPVWGNLGDFGWPYVTKFGSCASCNVSIVIVCLQVFLPMARKGWL